MFQRRLDLPEPLLDFEDPLERLDPDDVVRAGEELLEPELDLLTLGAGVLLDRRFPEEVERDIEDLLGPELDLLCFTLGLRLSLDDCFLVLAGVILYPEPVFLPSDRFELYSLLESFLLFRFVRFGLSSEFELVERLLTSCRLYVLSPGSGLLFLLFDDEIRRL